MRAAATAQALGTRRLPWRYVWHLCMRQSAGIGHATLPSRPYAVSRRHAHCRGCMALQGRRHLKDVAHIPLDAAASCKGPLTPCHGPYLQAWRQHLACCRCKTGLTNPCVGHCRSALWGRQGGLPLSLRIGRRSLPCKEGVLHQILCMTLCSGRARCNIVSMPTWLSEAS